MLLAAAVRETAAMHKSRLPKSVLGLPDLDHSRSSVLQSLGSAASQRTYGGVPFAETSSRLSLKRHLRVCRVCSQVVPPHPSRTLETVRTSRYVV